MPWLVQTSLVGRTASPSRCHVRQPTWHRHPPSRLGAVYRPTTATTIPMTTARPNTSAHAMVKGRWKRPGVPIPVMAAHCNRRIRGNGAIQAAGMA